MPLEIAPEENCLSDDLSPTLLSLGQMAPGKNAPAAPLPHREKSPQG